MQKQSKYAKPQAPMADKFRCELVSWRQVYQLARRVALKVKQADVKPDIIIAIGRGGYIPARILSDLLNIFNMTGFKIEHYIMGTHRQPVARVKYPLRANLNGLRVLVVDDVSDTGDTFQVALQHIEESSKPAQVKTAVLHHKTVSSFEPDFLGQKVIKWRWIIYPWAVIEDVSGFIQRLEGRPTTIEEIGRQLERDYGIRVPRETLKDALTLLEHKGR